MLMPRVMATRGNGGVGMSSLGDANGAYGLLDGGVDLGLSELGGYSDAVHDGFLVGGAVAYD